MNARDMRRRWNERYLAAQATGEYDEPGDREPSPLVVGAVAGLGPGTALDLGAGNGRHALWLAELAWTVTAVDFSSVAIEQLRASAQRRLADSPDRLTAHVADLTTYVHDAPVELVLYSFVHIPAAERRVALRLAALSVAPGGRLVVAGHHAHNIGRGTGGTQDRRVLATEDEIVDDLAGTDLDVLRAERVARPVDADGERREAVGLVVVARRSR